MSWEGSLNCADKRTHICFGASNRLLFCELLAEVGLRYKRKSTVFIAEVNVSVYCAKQVKHINKNLRDGF